jgi:hypothetical protein
VKYLIVFLAGIGIASCGEPSAPDACNTTPSSGTEHCGNPQVTQGCQTLVDVHISSDPSPRIDWSPECGMNHVVVRAARNDGQGQVFWAFTAENQLIGPGVRYGVLPAGSISEGPTRILQPGTAYRVSVEMIVDGNIITGQGFATFIR